MYGDQLEKLILFALSDGELTEKEKQILFKKAEAEGIDLDEFEMVLDARLFEKNNIKTNEVASAPKSGKFGDIKKCPACGAFIQSFNSSCADCGYEFRNVAANSSVKTLSEKLENVIKECNSMSFESKNLINEKLETKTVQEIRKKAEIFSRQNQIIKNFPIPNTKEDILELLHFIFPKTKISFTSDKDTIAWRNKFLEVINRAKVAYSKDSKMLAEIAAYEKNFEVSRFGKVLLIFSNLDSFGKLIVGWLIIFLILGTGAGIYEMLKSDEVKVESKRLTNLEKDITDDIRVKKFEEARILLTQMEWTVTENKKKNIVTDLLKIKDKYQDKIDYWHDKKFELEKLISVNKLKR